MQYILLGLAAAFTAVAAGFAIDCSVSLKRLHKMQAVMLKLIRDEQAANKAEVLHHIEHLAVHGSQRRVADAKAFIAERRAARGH